MVLRKLEYHNGKKNFGLFTELFSYVPHNQGKPAFLIVVQNTDCFR